MNCACHDQPAYWNGDKRMLAGGYWLCAVERRETSRRTYERRREQKLAQARDRYDNDPIYRIEKRLHDNAYQRRQSLERRRAALATEHGGS